LIKDPVLICRVFSYSTIGPYCGISRNLKLFGEIEKYQINEEDCYGMEEVKYENL